MAPRATGALIPTDLDQAVKLATLMSDGGLVPAHLQGKPANCLMVIEQAIRWGMSPFAVAQCTSVIQGKLMYEGKLVAAVVNSRGELTERLRFKYEGDGRDRTCIITGKLRGETEHRSVSVTFGLVRSRNEVWDRQPDQQLAYYGVRVWARRHLPEVMLGVYGPDENFDEEEAPEPTPEQKAWASYTGPKGATGEIVTSPLPASGVESAAPVASSTETSTYRPPISGPSADIVTTVLRTFPGATEPRSREPGEDDELGDPEDPKPGEYRDQVECWTWKGAKSNKNWGTGEGEWVSIGMEPQRSLDQSAKIHVEKKKRGYDDKVWREKLVTRFNKTSSSELSVREATALIDAMVRMTEQHGTAEQKQKKQKRRVGRMAEEIAQELGARGIGPADIE